MLLNKKYIHFFSFIFLILFFICIYSSQNLKLDASSDSLMLQNDETFEYYQYYNKIFPSKNFLVLAIKSKKEIDNKYIKNINNLKSKIKNIENVESTFSIVDAPILILNNSNLNELASQKIENINNTDKKIKLILNEFSSSPLFKNQIINENQNLSSIIIYIKKNLKFDNLKNEYNNLNDKKVNLQEIKFKYFKEKKINNQKKEKLIEELRELINQQNQDYEYFLGGIDMIASDTINFIKNDIILFSFAVIFFIILILFIIYKKIKWVLIPLLTTIYSVFLMLGLMSFIGWEITAISSNFISLMLILSISMNIHIINNYKINYLNINIKDKIFYTIKKIFWPCFYTMLTTIVAFGSLIFSDIKPIIDFGYIMMLALLIIFIISFTILPLMIYYFPKIENTNLQFKMLDYFYQISTKKIKYIFLINIIIFILSVYGITQLKVENSFINYFKSKTEIFKGMKLIDTELGGTTPLDIIIKFNDEIEDEKKLDITINTDSNDEDIFTEDLDLMENLFNDSNKNINNDIWFTQEKIKIISEIHHFLEEKKEIGKVQSIYSLIEMANLINKKPLSIFELSILYKEIPNIYKESLIKPYLSIENNMVKISSRIKDSDDIKRNKLINDINVHIENKYQNLNEFKINGLLVLYNNMLQSLFNSQIKSFGIILMSIFLMLIILFRSFKLSLVAMIPNIIASSTILGLIGLLNIPLDIMTITIAAITIGIAVDNTIHYIYRIQENKKIYQVSEIIIKKTNNNVGNAILTTSFTISFGFSVLCLSNFIPTILFGIFTALAMLIAMMGVLITLPSILIRFKI